MQSGGLNRERLYQAGFNPPRADRAGGRRADRARAELNGNPVQSGGLNRERLYRVGGGWIRWVGGGWTGWEGGQDAG